MTLLIGTGHWESMKILIPMSQCRWWDLHVDLLLSIPQMTRLVYVDTLLFQMNMIGVHQNIY